MFQTADTDRDQEVDQEGKTWSFRLISWLAMNREENVEC